MQKRLLSIAIAILCFLVALPASAAFTKREFRGSWISNAWALDWPKDDSGNVIYGTSATAQANQKAALIKILDNLKENGFNVAFFQVRSFCDAAYPSKYAPWTSYISGVRGTSPGWDPLAFAVEEAHKRGIELHAWLNPYRWANSTNHSFWSTSYDTTWESNGYLITTDATTSGTANGITTLNPGIWAVTEHIVNVVKEICSGYKVDGIVFDDYFYPNYYDKDALTATKNQYRAYVNEMVYQVYYAIKETRPEARFGIAPAGVAYWGASAVGVDYSVLTEKKASDWQYNGIYSDPLAWLNAGNIDYISPQLYWNTDHSTNPFGTLTTWWNGVAQKFNRHHFPSHNLEAFNRTAAKNESAYGGNVWETWVEFENQVKWTRNSSDNPGAVMFRQAFMGGPTLSGFDAFCGQYLFNVPALAPEVTWRGTGKTYTTVKNLSLSGSKLSWSSAAQDNEVLKYTVYAIPLSKTYEEVMTTDGINNAYLQGITYGTSYTVPTGDYWYAVCILDGLSHEYSPQFLGVAKSENTTLTSPINGAVAADGKFTWSAVANATFTLEISATSDFSSVALSQSGVTTNSATISLSSLLSNSTYYWRVKTRQTGTTEVVSAVASFTTPTYSPEQMDEAIYSSNGSMEFENLWMRKGDGNLETFTPNFNTCRDMALDKDFMYIICRESNAAASKCYIEKYDVNTGEKRGRLNITFPESSISLFPANNIFLDDAGNVCVSNLTTNCSTAPLLIHSINMTTGEATLRASIPTNDVVRFDHCDVLGDVVKGNFYVVAATSSSNYIYRWYYENGKRVVNNSYRGAPTVFVPSTATDFGSAPRIKAITKDKVIVDGQTTALTQYDISTSTPVATSFADASILPSTYNNNGFDWFKLDVNDVIVYNFADYSAGIKFNTAITGSIETDFGTAKQLGDWTFPREGLGSANSKNYTAEVDHYSISDTEVLVGVYAPGNGMGVYRIKKIKDIGTGIDDSLLDALTLVKSGCTITLSRPAAKVEIYNMAGAKVAEKQNVASFSTYLQPGAYIVRAIDNSGNIATKTIIF